VLWLWMLVIAATRSLSAATYPIRHPVIECDLERPFTRIVRFFTSSPRDAMEVNRKPSYTSFS